MPASDAGSALIAGQVPVAVTYEPYLTIAHGSRTRIKLIYSAGENPGLICDVFVVRDEFLNKRPGQVLALIKSWDAALQITMPTPTAAGRSSPRPSARSPRSSTPPLTACGYYSLAENKTAARRRLHHQDICRCRSRRQERQPAPGRRDAEQMIDPASSRRRMTAGRV